MRWFNPTYRDPIKELSWFSGGFGLILAYIVVRFVMRLTKLRQSLEICGSTLQRVREISDEYVSLLRVDKLSKCDVLSAHFYLEARFGLMCCLFCFFVVFVTMKICVSLRKKYQYGVCEDVGIRERKQG